MRYTRDFRVVAILFHVGPARGVFKLRPPRHAQDKEGLSPNDQVFPFRTTINAQTVDLDNPLIALRKLWIHALRNNPRSQASQTTEERRNRKEGLRSAAQDDVRNLYFGLGILHCSLWGLG